MEFIAQDSVYYADATARGIFNAPKRIKKFPLSGRIVPEFCDTTSEMKKRMDFEDGMLDDLKDMQRSIDKLERNTKIITEEKERAIEEKERIAEEKEQIAEEKDRIAAENAELRRRLAELA
jgi:Skp family chaperone for outer membrane proteins